MLNDDIALLMLEHNWRGMEMQQKNMTMILKIFLVKSDEKISSKETNKSIQTIWSRQQTFNTQVN